MWIADLHVVHGQHGVLHEVRNRLKYYSRPLSELNITVFGLVMLKVQQHVGL